jgi:ATPase family associated with various cellular activities (AAA)
MKESTIASNISVYDADDYKNLMDLKFFETGNNFYEKLSMKVKIGSIELFKIISELVNEEYTFNFFSSSFYIKNDNIFIKCFYDIEFTGTDNIEVDFDTDDYNFFEEKHQNVNGASGKYDIVFQGKDYNKIVSIKNKIEKILEPRKTYSVVWSFSGPDGSLNKKEIFLKDQEPLIPELYPWITDFSIQEYQKKYLESNDTILLLTGVPGTGKTTFIRNFIAENNLNANLTYDEKLIRSDNFFLRFINDKDKDVLIIEDADTLLYDREKDENSILSKILNISDGIVKNVGKKIIFSTNITDISRIDTALIRPGRCFDVLDFRKLTYEESLKLLKAKNINKEIENRSHTLAELFSTNNRKQFFTNKKVGF